ncbi:MAG: nucleoside deaminase [Vicinamibacteria bacterium]|nr:nucleoside deaminase [Vicinamibacteria bacterium]
MARKATSPTPKAKDEAFMHMALREASRGMKAGQGGPFGACIVRDGVIVAAAPNRVLASGNPTQHAEVVAIGRAAKNLGSHILKGCTIYSTTEPCPMCFSAIHWAQIDRIVFGTGIADVKRLGFNELTVSNATLKRLGRSRVILDQASKKECTDLLRSWAAMENRTTY